MRFVELEGGCIVCLSHKLNADGYLRKVWGSEGKHVAEFFHRFIYRAHHGEIPKGYEVDHMCNLRACCNPEHLQVLPRLEHLIKTNRLRYARRKEAARQWWLTNRSKGVELGAKFGVTFSAACGWIREWKRW